MMKSIKLMLISIWLLLWSFFIVAYGSEDINISVYVVTTLLLSALFMFAGGLNNEKQQ